MNVGPIERIAVDSADRAYTITIGRGLLSDLPNHYDFAQHSGVFCVTDDLVAQHWLESSSIPSPIGVACIPAGEVHKTLAQVEAVWRTLYECGADRDSLAIDLGGGVVGDLGGFAASTYLRGLDFVQVPTTLLAQVDASIGGKVGIDFNGSKNIIGSFCSPRHVFIDVDTLSTLPDRDFIAGYAEVIKHAAIADRGELDALEPLASSAAELVGVIARSCAIKAAVVSDDEREAGRRKILNFGHTIGHALESVALSTDSPLLHGEAVSLGIVAAGRLSTLHAGLPTRDADALEAKLARFGLPTSIDNDRLPVAAIVDQLRYDKKRTSSVIGWTLLDELGHAVFGVELPDRDARSAIEGLFR